MNKKVAQLWIKALRSGKYKQGQNVLLDEKNRYCCLGVLCDLYNKDCRSHKKRELTVRKSVEPDSNLEDDLHSFSFGGQTFRLPAAVKRWAGMRSDTGTMECPKGVLSKGEKWDEDVIRTDPTLAELNDGLWDSKKRSFDKIATIIEKNVDLL